MSDEKFKQEAPAGPGNKKHPKGAVNPPADSDPAVVKAKAKVNPQAVGAILGNADAVNKPPSPTEIEEAAKDEYSRKLAPSEALVHELPLQGDEEDPKTHATEPPADTDNRVLPDDDIDN